MSHMRPLKSTWPFNVTAVLLKNGLNATPDRLADISDVVLGQVIPLRHDADLDVFNIPVADGAGTLDCCMRSHPIWRPNVVIGRIFACQPWQNSAAQAL